MDLAQIFMIGMYQGFNGFISSGPGSALNTLNKVSTSCESEKDYAGVTVYEYFFSDGSSVVRRKDVISLGQQ